MTEHVVADHHIGAFTDDPPWIVDPDEMPWRTGIDELRLRANARVPELVRRRRLPPRRGARVAVTLGRVAIPWVVKHRRDRTDVAATAELAARLRPAFESLGTTFIKLGQLIASAEGMMPEAWVTEFKLCRDRVPAEPFDHVRRVVEEDLGQSIESLFSEFDPVPIAAASIAQVHAARLRSGEEVVVKVQRPNIDRIVPEDIATMAWLAPLIERRAANATFANLPAYIELFAETMVEELDFRLEAQNMLDIARVLALTDERTIVVPRPHPELVSRRVLVMERLRGHSLDDTSGLSDAGIDTTAVYRALMVSFLEGAMIHGVFHGDLHGGNMMVGLDGRPAIFDFGITGRFSEARRQALLGLLMASAVQDPVALLGFFRDLGGFPPDTDVETLVEELNLRELMTQDAGEVSPDVMALQMRETMNRLVAHNAKLPKELFLFMKGIVYLTGAITAMAADIDMFGEMAHIHEHFQTQHGEQISGLGIDDIPDGDAIAAMMRRQMGVDSDAMTLREMQEHQALRNEELRAATKRLG